MTDETTALVMKVSMIGIEKEKGNDEKKIPVGLRRRGVVGCRRPPPRVGNGGGEGLVMAAEAESICSLSSSVREFPLCRPSGVEVKLPCNWWIRTASNSGINIKSVRASLTIMEKDLQNMCLGKSKKSPPTIVNMVSNHF
jgi:hypothetical protein